MSSTKTNMDDSNKKLSSAIAAGLAYSFKQKLGKGTQLKNRIIKRRKLEPKLKPKLKPKNEDYEYSFNNSINEKLKALSFLYNEFLNNNEEEKHAEFEKKIKIINYIEKNLPQSIISNNISFIQRYDSDQLYPLVETNNINNNNDKINFYHIKKGNETNDYKKYDGAHKNYLNGYFQKIIKI
jgi:hypothetical protein